jgi:hypothetical protein
VLCGSFPLNKSLGFLHNSIDPERTSFDCRLTSETTTEITAPNTIVKLYGDAGDPYPYAKVHVGTGRKEEHVEGKNVARLKEVISGAAMSAIRSAFGEDTHRILQGHESFVNNGSSSRSSRMDPKASLHDDEELFQAVYAVSPDLRERVLFAPDAKAGSCNGLYYCDPQTNVWTRRHNVVFERLLMARFKTLGLSKSDKRHVNSRMGRSDMRYCLASETVDEAFEGELNADPNLFAVGNGVFDVRDRSFRPIVPEDRIRTTTGWTYSPEKAAEYRPEVEAFIRQVLPVPEERAVVMAFFGDLLCGHRNVRKFLVFTDRRAGANGKSTLAELMRTFFGKYAKSSPKFVCMGSFEKDRDSHGAGTENCNGKRLLVAEELKGHMTLDVATLKRLTGGASARVEDRKIGVGEEFEYVWQAGFLLTFNEGSCPRFDSRDAAFMERMIMVPMRSKFVTEGLEDVDQEGAEEYTYRMDLNVTKRFLLWMSALADMLMEARDNVDVLTGSSVTTSLDLWKARITTTPASVAIAATASCNNAVAEWAKAHVQVTRDAADVLLVADLKAEYIATLDNPSDKALSVVTRTFTPLLWGYLSTVEGVTKKDTGRVPVEGGGSEVKRGVLHGVRMAPSDYVPPDTKSFGSHPSVHSVRPSSNHVGSSESERLFGVGFESATGLQFERNVRPVWLRNPRTGVPMELDMYNAVRKLAVEYDGQHHYEYPNWYHRTIEEFEAQQARDRAKDSLCAERGVHLVRVRCMGLSRTAEEVRECVARLVAAEVLSSGELPM